MNNSLNAARRGELGTVLVLDTWAELAVADDLGIDAQKLDKAKEILRSMVAGGKLPSRVELVERVHHNLLFTTASFGPRGTKPFNPVKRQYTAEVHHIDAVDMLKVLTDLQRYGLDGEGLRKICSAEVGTAPVEEVAAEIPLKPAASVQVIADDDELMDRPQLVRLACTSAYGGNHDLIDTRFKNLKQNPELNASKQARGLFSKNRALRALWVIGLLPRWNGKILASTRNKHNLSVVNGE